MKISVMNDDGSVAFGYDTAMSSEQPFPAAADRQGIANALHDAQNFLGSDKSIIASITADIQSAIARIETELGAHPAFTWAQTKLGNAKAHLESYVAGIWTEPQPVTPPPGTAYDQRGAVVAVDNVSVTAQAGA